MTRHRTYRQKSMNPHSGISPANLSSAGYWHASHSGADGSALILNSEFCIPNWTFTFSAKERDTETGYSYFGARYYSSDLSIWLSVDPQSDKYPSLSPYTYCANNPVKLVDPNGEDYEVVVDNEKKTMTIRAVYYTANENKEKLQKGLDAWNEQSGKYSFVTGKGKDKQSYTINFELTIAEGDFANTIDAATAMPLDGRSNLFEITTDFGREENVNKIYKGITETGKQIKVKPDAPDRTISHEIGHSIGIGHFPDGLMETGGSGTSISPNNIESSLRGAGIIRIGTSTGTREYEGTAAKSRTQFKMYGEIKRNR